MGRRAWAAALVMLGVVAGCQTGGKVTTEPGRFREFAGAYRVSNGVIELVAVPPGGRVIALYRLDGGAVGENLLWVNPELSAMLSVASLEPHQWPNYGGDKTWPWSQSEWETVFGIAGWPPPREFDAAPFRITPIPRGLRLEGPVAAGQRMRVVREVTLPDDGPRVRVLSRIEAVGMGNPHPVAPWTVTQLPWPDEVRMVGAARPSGRPAGAQAGGVVGRWQVMSNDGTLWPNLRVEGDDVVLPGTPGPSAKVGADGEALVYRRGDVEFRQRVLSASPGRLEPAEQLQVFRTGRDEPGSPKDYIELEVTGPRVAVAPGRPAELVVEWEVRRAGR
ncbi:MAG: hypothetical protein ACK4PI_01980 [Tepidisphaerales bacterium]